MDVNEYMTKSLALLERIAEGIESLNESGIFIANQNDLENAIPVVVLGGGVSNVAVTVQDTSKKDAPKQESKPALADKPAETKKADAEPAAEAPKDDKPAETKAKKVTVDDARAALKKYAAIEGNDAAMELLTGLGAASVSALAEKGPEALQQLIDKCEGKGE